MQMGFEEEGVGARASDREIGLGFGGGYGKITGSTSHPRIHVIFIFGGINANTSAVDIWLLLKGIVEMANFLLSAYLAMALVDEKLPVI